MKRERIQTEPVQDTTASPPAASVPEHDDESWFGRDEQEGQLAVDVYQTPTAIVILSPIAGVDRSDLDITVHRDVVTIRGKRRPRTHMPESEYLFQECYWGSFSRSIILPTEVQVEHVTAELKSGVLTITLPKANSTAVRVIAVQGEDE